MTFVISSVKSTAFWYTSRFSNMKAMNGPPRWKGDQVRRVSRFDLNR